MLVLMIVALSVSLWTAGGSSSSTRGFPSFEELKRNGSLLDRFSTHDGERRRIPGLTFNCTAPMAQITKMTFIALPGADPIADEPPVIILQNGENEPFEVEYEMRGRIVFGEFGYEILVSQSDNVMINRGTRLRIRHPQYQYSAFRTLYKIGGEAGNFEYPLLAIETDPPGCIEGVVSAVELKRQWENRPLPVLYTSPEREIPLDCTSSGLTTITSITVAVTGDFPAPHILIYDDDNDHNCSVEYFTERVKTYECNISIKEDNSLIINQRDSMIQIGFLHDGESDTPLISIGGNCDDSSKLSIEKLVEYTNLYIPNIVERTDDIIEFEHLNITVDGQLVKWWFVSRYIGQGQDYPELSISSPSGAQKLVESNNCSATVYPNVYVCNVNKSVKTGDFISLHLPALSNAKLLLSFILNEAPPGESLNGRGDIPGLPLISMEIIPSQSLIPSIIIQATSSLNKLNTVSPTQPTNSPSGPSDDASDPPLNSNITGTIVGVVMGLLIAILLFMIVVILLLYILYRRKSSQYKLKEEEKTDDAEESARTPMDNPVYSGRDAEPARLTQQQYPVQLPPPPVNSTMSQVYEVPDITPSNGERKTNNKSFDNPEYYSSIQDVHSNTDNNISTGLLSSNHYEMAIYVPTQEQRKYVESGAIPTENIYATLEESQADSLGRTLSFFEECDTYWKPSSNKDELYAQLSQRKYREIPKHHIRITEHLGSGQFGTVNKGVWGSGGSGGQGGIEVAVKMLQEGISEQDTVRFLQEAAINGQFRHPNIVELLGVVTVGKPVMIVLELVSNGDLRDYLLKHKPTPGELPPSDTAALLSQFSVQVARGMKYLSSKAFVHRDLAARNILVTDTKTCKISDFGMARDLEEGTYYVSHGGKIPVKWTAPEALHYKKYSTASDVWSFGCLMYEIWSLGHKPFEGYTNPDTIKLIDNGCRLAPPPGCPLEMYRLMILCWNVDKSSRPQFREIVETLSQPEDLLLHIPEEVTKDHPQASILGAPLEAGRHLYTELQNTYL